MSLIWRRPTSDDSVTGTVSGTVSSRYTLVNDHPDSTAATYLEFGTATSYMSFGFTPAFNIPVGATSISVQVIYYDTEGTSGTNNCGGSLKVGGGYYNAATHNPTTSITLRTDNWATNPKTTVAWTVDDINGVGVNALEGFGCYSTDSSPAYRISSIVVQITYTGDPCVPDAPTGFTVTGGENKESLSWTEAAAGETPDSYKIWRSTNNVDFTLIDTIDAPATSYVDKRYSSATYQTNWSYTCHLGLDRDTTYYYKLAAMNVAGDSTQVADNDPTTIATAYTTGTIRGKVLTALVMTSTGHMDASYTPSVAQYTSMHDWLRANFSTKITLFLSKDIITATGPGLTYDLQQKAVEWVGSYDYDIVILPHNAWYPTNPTWTEGQTTELANMQTCHDDCYTLFGKYPIGAFAWHYSTAYHQKCVDLGYDICAGDQRAIF